MGLRHSLRRLPDRLALEFEKIEFLLDRVPAGKSLVLRGHERMSEMVDRTNPRFDPTETESCC